MSEIMIEYAKEIIRKDSALWIKTLEEKFGLSYDEAEAAAKEIEEKCLKELLKWAKEKIIMCDQVEKNIRESEIEKARILLAKGVEEDIIKSVFNLSNEELKALKNDYKYMKHLENITQPIEADKLPKIKIDLKGLMTYAASQGKDVVDLTEEEKNMFVENLEGNEKLCALEKEEKKRKNTKGTEGDIADL